MLKLKLARNWPVDKAFAKVGSCNLILSRNNKHFRCWIDLISPCKWNKKQLTNKILQYFDRFFGSLSVFWRFCWEKKINIVMKMVNSMCVVCCRKYYRKYWRVVHFITQVSKWGGKIDRSKNQHKSLQIVSSTTIYKYPVL